MTKYYQNKNTCQSLKVKIRKKKMQEKSKDIMAKNKAAIFVDDANLFYAQKKVGWKIDLKKLKKILEQEVKIQFINYYIALPAKWDHAYNETENYLKKIKKSANIKTKPLKYIRSKGSLIKKGDVDLELSLDVVRELQKLNIIIIVSGDSDYVELRKYVLEKGKKIIFFGFRENMAWEIKKGKYCLFNNIRRFVELNKKTPGCYPRRLLLSNLYQKSKNLSSTKKVKKQEKRKCEKNQ